MHCVCRAIYIQLRLTHSYNHVHLSTSGHKLTLTELVKPPFRRERPKLVLGSRSPRRLLYSLVQRYRNG